MGGREALRRWRLRHMEDGSGFGRHSGKDQETVFRFRTLLGAAVLGLESGVFWEVDLVPVAGYSIVHIYSDYQKERGFRNRKKLIVVGDKRAGLTAAEPGVRSLIRLKGTISTI